MLLIHHCVFKNDYALSGKVFKGAPAPKVTQLLLAMKFIRHKENNFVSAPNENIIVDRRKWYTNLLTQKSVHCWRSRYTLLRCQGIIESKSGTINLFMLAG